MCGPVAWAVASTAVAAYGAYSQSKSINAAADYNETVSRYAAADANRRGEEEAQRIQREARMLKGTQRASYAAKGLDLREGTVGQVLDETDFFGQVDAATARTNARNEAWGITAQGRNQPRSNTGLAVATSLLSGTGTVADKWYAANPGGAGGGVRQAKPGRLT